jgi:anaphase-promoting complex subunit 2
LQAAEAEDYSDMNWDPEPIDAGPDFRANKPSDVVSTLVSIYDSRDLFVKELQVLLAQRLLAIKEDGYEKVDKEVLVSDEKFLIHCSYSSRGETSKS